MNYNEALTYINSFSRFKKERTFGNIKVVLNKIDNPQDNLEYIHIAGTNGKGSTSTMISNTLVNNGYKTGLFISPFIVDFRERIQINNEYILKKDLAKCTKYIKNVVEELNIALTYFDIVTIIAFYYFDMQKCDIICLEVGIGGLLDSTNVIKSSLISIITSISLDHTKLLGNSIEEISIQKAGIIKENTTTILYPIQHLDTYKVINDICIRKNTNLIIPNLKELKIIDTNILDTKFIYKNISYKLSLCGKFQIYNAITAITCIFELYKMGFQIDYKNICNSLENIKFPARMEVINNKPTIILDGAHNIGGIKALCENLKIIKEDSNQKIIVVIGILEDKNYIEMIKLICGLANKLIVTTPNTKRALNGELLLQEANKYLDNVIFVENINNYTFFNNISNTSDLIIVCGSLYFVSEIRKLFIK